MISFLDLALIGFTFALVLFCLMRLIRHEEKRQRRQELRDFDKAMRELDREGLNIGREWLSQHKPTGWEKAENVLKLPSTIKVTLKSGAVYQWDKEGFGKSIVEDDTGEVDTEPPLSRAEQQAIEWLQENEDML